MQHTYADSRASAYSLSVLVTDATNQTTIAGANVTVKNVAPTGQIELASRALTITTLHRRGCER